VHSLCLCECADSLICRLRKGFLGTKSRPSPDRVPFGGEIKKCKKEKVIEKEVAKREEGMEKEREINEHPLNPGTSGNVIPISIEAPL